MCGLVGVAGRIFQKEEDAFKILLKLDTLRGPHSTGVLAVSENGNYTIAKRVGTPWELFSYKESDELFRYTSVLYLGHNRFATKGGITEENAHPFDVKDIVGAHNGTIRNQSELEDSNLFTVDSENILHSFCKVGVEETLKIVQGAFAIEWYDKVSHTLNFCRNYERPLNYCYSVDHRTLFWASETWMLDVALSKSGIKHEEIKTFSTSTLYSCKLPSVKPEKIKSALEMTEQPLEFYTPPPRVSPESHYAGPYHGPNVSYLPKPPVVSKLKKFLNKTVRFSTVGEVESKDGNFIRAYLEDIGADVVEVRLFLDPKSKTYKSALDGKYFFTGLVRKITTTDKLSYLIINNRTIRKSGNIKDDGGVCPFDEYVIVLGERISMDEWYERTSKGCDGCGEFPDIQQSDDIMWYTPTNFVCDKCSQTEEIQNYLSVCKQELYV